MKKFSLRLRLTIAFIGLAIIPVSLLGVLSTLHEFESHTESAYQQQQQIAHRMAIQVSAFLGQFEQRMRYFVESHDLNSLPREELVEALSEFITKARFFADLRLLDVDGVERVQASRTRLIDINEQPSEAAYRSVAFRAAVKIGEFHAGKVHFHPETGEPLITLALPVIELKSGAVSLVLMATARIRTIWELVIKIDPKSTDNVYIVDDASRIIAHRNPTIVLRGTTFSGTGGASVQRGLSGSQIILGTHQLNFGGQRFDVLVERDADKALAYARASLMRFIMMVLISLVAAIIMVSLSIKSIISPVERLTAAVRTIRDGDLSHRAQIDSNDEIGELGRDFNEMTSQLQSTMQILSEEEMRTRLLLDSTVEAIFGIDSKGICTFVNPACLRMLGYQDKDSLIGHNIHELIHHKRDDGTPYPQDECSSTKAIQAGVGIHIEDELLWRADGSSFPAEYMTHPISHNGVITGAVVTFLDITERHKSDTALRESEAHLRTLVETLPDLIWLKDPDGLYLGCNPKFERLYGAKESEIIGKRDRDFVDEELADFFREKDKAAMAAGEPSLNEEEVTYADDGHRELLETVKMPMFSADGKLIGVLGVGRDITERRKTEDALRRSQKMDAIGQLTGGIAHDFNNLLGVILGNTELLELQVPVDDKTHQRLESIKKAGQRAVNLTKQLLGFSRSEAGRSLVTDINQVIGGMENLIARALTPQVEVEHQFAEDLWLTRIDPGDFEDVLLNLSINARDAMNSQGCLTLETRNATLDTAYCARNPDVTPGEYVELAVSDSGEGIPAEELERIFEPFYTTKEQGRGTGLGLSMVYGFVNRSGGHIKCYSEEGVGTTFRLYLPRAVEDEPSVVKKDEEAKELDRGQETILAVDDEVGLLELARELLEVQGYHVLTAINGQQALERLAEEPEIELLFSDVIMPGGLNGYELAEQATTNYPGLKVLLTSGYTAKAVTHSGHAIFEANLLSKPYSQAELAKRVRAVLDGEAEA